MALIKENDLTEGMSGKFGKKVVFRVVKGVTVAARRSTKERVLTPKQIAHQERFKLAAEYAKAKMQDPVAKAAYKKIAGDEAFSNPFATALRDYLVAPKVLDVVITEFTGAAGSIIPVKVAEYGKVIRVKVAVIDGNGSAVESGEASLAVGDLHWKYVTTQALASLSGAKIVVTAIDRPGNETTYEKLIT